MTRTVLTLLTTLSVLASDARAQNTVDVGVLKNEDVQIVQKLLYPKAGGTEMGLLLGWMPFDAFTTTPMGAFTYAFHMREDLGIEVLAMGGYSLKNAHYTELEGPAYGVAPDAYRFLGAGMVDIQWAPIYAKMNVMGERIYHHDVFFTGGLGVTYEEAIQPDHTSALAPTLGIGVGARIYTGNHYAVRVQLRDDILREKRAKTADTKPWFIKQNVGILIGVTKLSSQ